jgi:GNAT superfamily N-acetyltransferase
MLPLRIVVRDDDRPELDALLVERIYEFNCSTTGIHDGIALNASVNDDAGRLVAGLSGHTWGRCCTIVLLWVDASIRGSGVGRALMQAAEEEALRRGCRQMVLSTHSFQAPRFYEKLGFQRHAAIPDNPAGHEDFIYIKYLPTTSRSSTARDTCSRHERVEPPKDELTTA